jgi:hypothetical protein
MQAERLENKAMLTKEKKLPVPDACEWIAENAGIPKPCAATVRRWMHGLGVSGPKLKSIRINGTFYTQASWIAEFLENNSDDNGSLEATAAAVAVEKQAVVDHVRNQCGIKKPGRPKSK